MPNGITAAENNMLSIKSKHMEPAELKALKGLQGSGGCVSHYAGPRPGIKVEDDDHHHLPVQMICLFTRHRVCGVADSVADSLSDAQFAPLNSGVLPSTALLKKTLQLPHVTTP